MISFRYRSKSLTFSPGLISTAITLLLLPLFVYLGFWQLHRMEEKQRLQDKIEHYSSNQVPTLFDPSFEQKILNQKGTTSFFDITDQFRYQKLQVSGRFLNHINFLLDNQILNGRVGYAVLTAFQIENSDFIILVNRGWIPRKQSLQKNKMAENIKPSQSMQTMQIKQNQRNLPNIEPILGQITLTGMINRPSHGIILNSNSFMDLPDLSRTDTSNHNVTQTNQSFLIQNIDFKELSGIVSNLLLPISLQLPKESPYAFEVLPVDFRQNISRHLGYAVQWFSIAIACLIYYLVINTRSRKI